MNEKNKKTNINEEMERAITARDAAVFLFSNGFVTDAISKLYYFPLSNVRALLLTKGIEADGDDTLPTIP